MTTEWKPSDWPLTRREWVVLCLWISGMSRRQMSESLGIGPETVKSTIARISEKRGLRGRFDAIRYGPDRDRPPVVATPDLARGA